MLPDRELSRMSSPMLSLELFLELEPELLPELLLELPRMLPLPASLGLDEPERPIDPPLTELPLRPPDDPSDAPRPLELEVFLSRSVMMSFLHILLVAVRSEAGGASTRSLERGPEKGISGANFRRVAGSARASRDRA